MESNTKGAARGAGDGALGRAALHPIATPHAPHALNGPRGASMSEHIAAPREPEASSAMQHESATASGPSEPQSSDMQLSPEAASPEVSPEVTSPQVTSPEV